MGASFCRAVLYGGKEEPCRGSKGVVRDDLICTIEMERDQGGRRGLTRVGTGWARDQNKGVRDGGVAVPSRALTGPLFLEEDQQHDLAGWIPRDLTDRKL